MSNLKSRSFGGTTITGISPPIPIGKGVTRQEAKMYNINLSYEGVLRLVQAGQNAAAHLSQFKENSKDHTQGVNLVINLETGRVDFSAVSYR